ncbi:hypothetical protein, conserved [Babesia ovata]|uniref:Uncharacterized protein n=1 Tax=Babesia ovata TaxID=189622 RepID=A0A2H6KD64_9APIC|nr:uncharacterized protein BOVATA_024260 [Babesia ovata]GBE60933.1 hypothetical protein, conserved [Babesia ovata]
MSSKNPGRSAKKDVDTNAAETKSEDSADGFIEVMARSLQELKLAPSPAPRKVLQIFEQNSAKLPDRCDYCGAEGADSTVPEVSFNLQKRTATLLGRKGACMRCYQILNLRQLNNHIASAAMRHRGEFDGVYEHFLEVNQIKDRNAVELQGAVSIANSLQVIYSEIEWACVDG